MTFSLPQIGKSLVLAVLGGGMTITVAAVILDLGSAAHGAHSFAYQITEVGLLPAARLTL
jgi:hypothetical protein